MGFILLAAVLIFAQAFTQAAALAEASPPSPAKLQAETVLAGSVKAYEYTLGNGLTVVLTPNNRAPLFVKRCFSQRVKSTFRLLGWHSMWSSNLHQTA